LAFGITEMVTAEAINGSGGRDSKSRTPDPWIGCTPSKVTCTKIKEDLDDVRDDVIGVYQLMCK
jgi:hypothetical protein